MLATKRAYEPYNKNDGQRVLIDRLWPRGLSKQKIHIELWLKDIAPSTKLRKWFDHDPGKWTEFQKRYRAELRDNDKAVGRLRECIDKGKTTIIYGAKDEEHNDAVVLKKYLEDN